MNHSGTVRLETKRLLLRPFTPSDSLAAFQNWTSDDEVTKFLRWPAHQDVKTTEDIIRHWVISYANPDFYQWAIVIKGGSGEPVGTISVVEQNERLGMMHIGYCIGRNWWHQGITSEAFAGILPFLFEEVRVNRVESQHDPDNPNSGKVMLKCGLTYAGTLRQADYSNRGLVDASMYSLLAEDYFRKQRC